MDCYKHSTERYPYLKREEFSGQASDCRLIMGDHKETTVHGHDRHNTTILSIIHNMSTTCFGQCYFWPSSGWIKLSEKTTQYNIKVKQSRYRPGVVQGVPGS